MIHKFIFHKKTYTLSDEEVSKSPYLSTLVKTDLPVERDNKDRIILELDVGPTIVDNYFNYLKGNKFMFNTDSIIEFFNFMGHTNEFMYPDRYWRQLIASERHNICGSKEGKGNVVLVNTLHIPDIDLRLHGTGIDLYYVGDMALFHAGTISKFGHLTIVYHRKDMQKLKDAFKHQTEKEILVIKTAKFNYTTNEISKDNKPKYRLLKPMLDYDDEMRRGRNMNKIWNDPNIYINFVPADFKCVEELLYLFPADTDGIVLHKRDSEVIEFKMTNRTYNSLVTRQVYLRPDKISAKYIERLCTLSLMDFKIIIPSYDTNIDNHLILQEYEEHGGNDKHVIHNNPSVHMSYIIKLNKLHRYTVEDYIALLSLGATRPITSGYLKPDDKPLDIDYSEVYPLTLFSHEDIFQYQFDVHNLGNRTEEEVQHEYDLLPKLYRVTRLRMHDAKIEGVTYDEHGFGFASLPFIREYVMKDMN